MRCKSYHSNLSDLDKICAEISGEKPSFVLIFASSPIMKDTAFKEKIAGLKGVTHIGCSTSGEIGSKGVKDDSISLTSIKFDNTSVKTAVAEVNGGAGSAAAGGALADELKQGDLKAIFTLGPGVNINGSAFVNGIVDKVGKNIVVTGGLAGDGTNFKSTVTLCNGELYDNKAVGLGLYGEHVVIKSGSRGGWSTFGPARRVTRSEANVLFELDGRPALDLYKEYLGDKAKDLPSSGLLYPFAILREDHSTTGLIRTILDVNHENGSLVLAGDLPQGSTVCLMHADNDSLVEGSGQAAEEAAVDDEGVDTLAVLISCVGRKLVMGMDVDEEVEVVQDLFGKNTAITGFYSYGEICPFSETGKSELHNQTMTITCITERKAA